MTPDLARVLGLAILVLAIVLCIARGRELTGGQRSRQVLLAVVLVLLVAPAALLVALLVAD